MDTFREAILVVSREYSREVRDNGGKSLARVATIVANRGSFFDGLERGMECTSANLDKFAAYFRVPGNWPRGAIPGLAEDALNSMGRPVLPESEAAE